jgi:hypothetical protein
MQCTMKYIDRCLTDPEPGMDSGRATVRNVRSKCRCSCVLQFTFRRAVSCVLHRPPSQVIHCIVLFLFKFSRTRQPSFKETNTCKFFNIPNREGLNSNQRKGESSLDGFRSPHVDRETVPKSSATETSKEALTATKHVNRVSPGADGLEALGNE